MAPSSELIKSCIKGKEKAHYELFKLCFSYMMSIAVKYYNNHDDARAQVNAAFYKVLTHLETFHQENSFDAWVKRITVNTILSDFRSLKGYKQAISPVNFEENLGELDSEEAAMADDRFEYEDIMRLMQELKEEERHILMLHAVDGYQHKEIAEMLQIPEGTCRWHLSNARKNLKVKLLRLEQHYKIRTV